MSLFDGGNKGLKFETFGTSHTGRVTSEPRAQQQTKFGTNEPDFWPSGDPKMQILVNLQTNYQDDPDDDGGRTLYVSSSAMRSAIGDAMRKSGAKDITVGGTLTVTYTGNDPQSKNPANPKKLYQATYVPPASPLAQEATEQWAQPVAAPVQQAPVQQYQQPMQPVLPMQPIQQQPVPMQMQVPTPQPVAPAMAQPTHTPPPAQPVATPTGQDPNSQIRLLIGIGQDDTTIASTLGLPLEQIAQIRAAG